MEEQKIAMGFVSFLEKRFIMKNYSLRNVFIILLSLLSLKMFAQNLDRTNYEFGVAVSLAEQEVNLAASWNIQYTLGSKAKFKLGYGLRVNSYRAQKKNYVTAPANLTNRKTGPLVFFTKNIFENFDTFYFQNA